MTQKQAIAELQCQIDQCERQLLYYEENAPGHNNSAIITYKQALEIAVDAIKEKIKRQEKSDVREEKECWYCGEIVDSECRCCTNCGHWF